jgi:hypothetical protein
MKRSSKESQARLFAIAEAQGGFFTAKQVEDAGFDRTNHAYHLRVGNWQREHRGIYRPKLSKNRKKSTARHHTRLLARAPAYWL